MRVVPELVRQVSPVTDLRATAALTRVFRELRPDVVHTNSSKAGIVGRMAARRAAVPRVLHTVHGWPFHAGQAAPAGAVWRTLERRTAPLAERLVVVADADREKGLAAGIGRDEQYVTVRSGLELDRYGADALVRQEVRSELGLPADARVLGAVNRLSPQKDPLSLVAACALVLRQRPDARLLLVGDGPLRGGVEDLVTSSGVAGQVVLVGLRDDVPRLLSAMDVFVSASRWEGLPRTVLQAVATGLPVIATSADGVVDVVQDGRTGVLVPVGSVEALAAGAARLLDRPQEGARLARPAAARLPEFDASTMVRQLEALYLGEGP